MKSRRTVEIDGAKLQGIFEKRGLSSAIVSQELGYTSSYIAQVYKSNRISPQSIAWLENKYGITRESIAKEQPAEASEAVVKAPETVEAILIALKNINEKLTTLEGYIKGCMESAHDTYENTAGLAAGVTKLIETAEKQFCIEKKHYDGWVNHTKYGRIS